MLNEDIHATASHETILCTEISENWLGIANTNSNRVSSSKKIHGEKGWFASSKKTGLEGPISSRSFSCTPQTPHQKLLKSNEVISPTRPVGGTTRTTSDKDVSCRLPPSSRTFANSVTAAPSRKVSRLIRPTVCETQTSCSCKDSPSITSNSGMQICSLCGGIMVKKPQIETLLPITACNSTTRTEEVVADGSVSECYLKYEQGCAPLPHVKKFCKELTEEEDVDDNRLRKWMARLKVVEGQFAAVDCSLRSIFRIIDSKEVNLKLSLHIAYNSQYNFCFLSVMYIENNRTCK